MTLAVIIVAVMLVVAFAAAAGAFDRTRPTSVRRRVVERPVETVETVVEDVPTTRVTRQRRYR